MRDGQEGGVINIEDFPMPSRVKLNCSVNLSGIPFLASFLDAVSNPMIVLDENLQVVMVNESLSAAENHGTAIDFTGFTLGEVMNCRHSGEDGAACGEGRFCRFCCLRGVAISGLAGEKVTKDCTISKKDGLGLIFRAQAVPFVYEGCRYVVISLQDISSERRRRTLERLFFHDILNTAGVIYTTSNFIGDAPPEVHPRLMNIIQDSAQILIHEIEGQKELSAAENNELLVEPEPINVYKLTDELTRIYRQHFAAKGRQLVVGDCPGDLEISSDRSLIKRVLANMIKNALEASGEGDLVTINCVPDNGGVIFSVHNPADMPPEVKNQVFKRKFSTKGEGRGIGTYSMRLLTLRYLSGQVYFKSEPGYGTTFYLKLPRELKK